METCSMTYHQLATLLLILACELRSFDSCMQCCSNKNLRRTPPLSFPLNFWKVQISCIRLRELWTNMLNLQKEQTRGCWFTNLLRMHTCSLLLVEVTTTRSVPPNSELFSSQGSSCIHFAHFTICLADCQLPAGDSLISLFEEVNSPGPGCRTK